MEPLLRDGDLLLISLVPATAPTPPAGSVVVADLPGDRGLGIKRLAHLEPDGDLWLARENPRQGSDSWVFGAVPRADLIGVARARLWPRPRRLGPDADPG